MKSYLPPHHLPGEASSLNCSYHCLKSGKKEVGGGGKGKKRKKPEAQPNSFAVLKEGTGLSSEPPDIWTGLEGHYLLKLILSS